MAFDPFRFRNGATQATVMPIVRDMPRRSSTKLWVWLLPLLAIVASVQATAAPRNESEAERLHRKGVHCMEVIERNECAIDNFEELLDVETTERELVTDGLIRLIDLYGEEGRQGDIPTLLRRFWDVGMKRGSAGHMPWSMRFMPSELNMLFVLDVQQMVTSGAFKDLGPETTDFFLTCDEARRRDIRERKQWRRAERIAKEEGKEAWEVRYEQMDADRERKKKAEARRKKSGADEDAVPPVFSEATCEVARALGHEGLHEWRKLGGAVNHRNPQLSVAVAQIPKLEADLAAAQKAGRIEQISTDHWIIPDSEYAGRPLHLARLDLEELTVAPANLIETVIANRGKRRPQLNREVDKLAKKVPRDAGFFLVLNQAALRELGFSSMKRSRRSVLEALLPKPKGMQVAAVFADSVGLFTRVPTDSAVKGRMLVSVANALLARAAEDDAEARKWLDGLDIAEASDRRALLASYVISGRQLEKLTEGW